MCQSTSQRASGQLLLALLVKVFGAVEQPSADFSLGNCSFNVANELHQQQQ